jgi:predicted outer membrane repeat protein
MNKVALFTLVLAACGMLDNTVLAQEQPRYRVTFIKNQTAGAGAAILSATVVTVVNQSSTSCGVRVEWFRQTGASACLSRVVDVGPGQAVQFCSRGQPLLPTISDCHTVGLCPVPSPANGTAVVFSEPQPGCDLLAVEARVYYFSTTAGGDTAIQAVSNSRVVFFGEANLGD